MKLSNLGISHNGWTLKNEIKFIISLGMGIFALESVKVRSKTRKFMLKNYKKAAKTRSWQGIDGKEAVRFALRLLQTV